MENSRYNLRQEYFFTGFFATTHPWPNRIGVQHKGDAENLNLVDNTVDIGKTPVSFLGGATATVTGIAQFNLPNDELSMLEIHNTHGSVEGLVKLRLAPYTMECLSASAQLLTPEMHYNGGKAQMGQDYIDQLKNGAFLLEINKVVRYDSIDKEYKQEYVVEKQLDKNRTPKRKFSSIKSYNITIGDAQITKTEYERRIVDMLGKQIDASSAASVAKQAYVTAQQQALTAKAQGEKKLVETEYAKKVEQTNQVVAAETKVKIQEQYKFEQKAAAEAAVFAAQKVKTDADAAAYEARQMVSAGLSPLDRANIEKDTKIGVAQAMSKMVWPATYINGGSSNGNGLMENILMSMYLQQTKK
ncbi:MAG: hypothetical protein V4547_18045 [Bacteroidota bacterium]